MSSKGTFTSEPGATPDYLDSWESDFEGMGDYDIDQSLCFSSSILDALARAEEGQQHFLREEGQSAPLSSEFLYGVIAKTADDANNLNIPAVFYNEREDEYCLSAECGDDNIKLTNQPALALVASQLSCSLFGMVLSLDDTGLSTQVANYTEKWVAMPRDRLDLAGKIKVKGADRTTPVIDVPSLRTLIAGAAQTRDEIQTSILGKTTLVARSLSYTRGTEEESLCWRVSILQDVMLSAMTKGGRFPYLPQALGGLDKPFPMNCQKNIGRACKAWKRGRYERLLYTIIGQTNYLVNQDRAPFEPDPFIAKVKDMFSGYSPEYMYYRRNLPLTKGLTPPWSMEFYLGSFSTDAASNAALRRLRTSGMVVSEKELIMANEVEEHVRGILSTSALDYDELRRDAAETIRRVTVEARCFSALWNEYGGTNVISSGLTSSDIAFAMSMGLDTSQRVSNFLFGERFFSREALDRIYIKGPTKVDFPLLVQGKAIRGRQGVECALEDPIPEDVLEKYEDLLRWAIGQRGSLPPRDLLEDDDIIVQDVMERVARSRSPIYVAVIATEDKALCSRVNVQTGAVVIRIPLDLLYHAESGVIHTPTGVKDRGGVASVLASRLKDIIPRSIQSELLDCGDLWVDTGGREAVDMMNVAFPFRQRAARSEGDSTYFEYRVPMDRIESLQARFDTWPGGPGLVYDVQGLIDYGRPVKGNPVTGLESAAGRGKGLFQSTTKALSGKATALRKMTVARVSSLRALGHRAKNKTLGEEELRELFFAGEGG